MGGSLEPIDASLDASTTCSQMPLRGTIESVYKGPLYTPEHNPIARTMNPCIRLEY